MTGTYFGGRSNNVNSLKKFAELAATKDFKASITIQSAKDELVEASIILSKPAEKPIKWSKGISKILAGGAGAIGNVPLSAGMIPVAAPVGAAAVLVPELVQSF